MGLMVTPLPDGKTWEVVEDYQILLPIVFSLQKLTVPKGFQFDLFQKNIKGTSNNTFYGVCLRLYFSILKEGHSGN